MPRSGKPIPRSGRIQELPGEHPPDITLLSTSTNETKRRWTEVANLQAIDEDPTTRYSLVEGIASVDNDKFKVIGDKLISKQPINYRKQKDYFIRVRSHDADGDVREEAIKLSVSSPTASDSVTGLSDINGNTSWTPYDKTSVNVINNTSSPFILWNDVNDNRRLLQPSQQQRITNWRETKTDGEEDKDITVKFYIPKTKASSTYIGTFWFHNYAGHPAGAAPWMGSDRKSFFTTGFSSSSDWPWVVKTSYAEPNKTWRLAREEARSSFSVPNNWGEVAASSYQSPLRDDIAFASFYLGSVNGQKRWDLVATKLPPAT